MSTRTQTGDTTPLLTQGIQIQAYCSKLLACVTRRHPNHDLILYTPSRRSSGNLPESSGMQENKHFKQVSGQASGNLPVSSGTAEIMKNKKQASEQASGNLPEPSGTATRRRDSKGSVSFRTSFRKPSGTFRMPANLKIWFDYRSPLKK